MMKRRALGLDQILPKLTFFVRTVILCMVATLCTSTTLQAATILVHSVSDSSNANQCTLRKAIESFNNLTLSAGCSLSTNQPFRSDDTILFSGALKNSKITLSGAELVVAGGNELHINASPIGGITIDANRQTRVISINASVVTFNNIALTGGFVVGFSGGGIKAQSSTITLNNSSVTGNESIGTVYVGGGGDGGGISASNSSIALYNSLIDRNQARTPLVGFGGGISISGGDLTVNNSTISNNFSLGGGGRGGGIYASGTIIAINNSALSENDNRSPFRAGHAISFGGGLRL